MVLTDVKYWKTAAEVRQFIKTRMSRRILVRIEGLMDALLIEESLLAQNEEAVFDFGRNLSAVNEEFWISGDFKFE